MTGDEPRWTSLDLAEGFHLAHVVDALHELGVLEALVAPKSVEGTAAELGLDAEMLRPLLHLVAERTDLLDRQGEQFQRTPRYDPDSRFLLDQYVGAYGPAARDLASSLGRPGQARGRVDAERHARAFAEIDSPGAAVLPAFVVELGLNAVVDLGCGPGALLVELARRDPKFIGWGLDANPRMCTAARKRIQAEGLAGRIVVYDGDCRDPGSALSSDVLDRVQAATAASLLNEFFGQGEAEAVAWLRRLRELLPGRALVVADYYGRLGRRDPPWPRRTALHDLVQVISGQGAPPPDREAWADVYAAAGCQVAHMAEDESGSWFVHIVRLG